MLNNWLDKIEEKCANNIKLGLDNIKQAIKLLDIKLKKPIIMVAGTNGKGSCINMMESYLQDDFKFATYTSPHLVDFRERITINKKK